MSRKGNYWDNAVADIFFKSMKNRKGVPPCHYENLFLQSGCGYLKKVSIETLQFQFI